MTWRTFKEAQPDMAEFGEREFERSRMALLGTVRKDGSPRISCVEPYTAGGNLYLGMMWRSRKALDLVRDPRVLVRNATCSNTGEEAELSIRGRAFEIRDPQIRRAYVDASGIPWKEPHFHLFSVDVESASLVQYGAGQQTVRVWPQGIAFTRPYG